MYKNSKIGDLDMIEIGLSMDEDENFNTEENEIT